ncbi:MAG TPA: aspartate dehydrogenase [Patescibacteria group bacterium]|nr:aspartate dehydrogenase [Patescibacteria group bacterium]
MRGACTIKIGIAGCGAIGSSLAKYIAEYFPARGALCGVYDTDNARAALLAKACGRSRLAVASLEALIARSDLIIEAAAAGAAYAIAEKTLRASRDIMIMSVGGIIEGYKELIALAQERGCRIFIPSGAVCGLDGLKACACGKIKKVTLTTTKPPRAFRGVAYVHSARIDLAAIKKDAVLFEGSANAAIKAFPQNINVAAILSIAGIGPAKTRVRIVASPRVSKNTHQIDIESDAGTMTVRTENVIHPANPKTSYLAVLSAIACVRQIAYPLHIGT